MRFLFSLFMSLFIELRIIFVFADGRFGDVNMEGIDHYNRMINAILKKGSN